MNDTKRPARDARRYAGKTPLDLTFDEDEHGFFVAAKLQEPQPGEVDVELMLSDDDEPAPVFAPFISMTPAAAEEFTLTPGGNADLLARDFGNDFIHGGTPGPYPEQPPRSPRSVKPKRRRARRK